MCCIRNVAIVLNGWSSGLSLSLSSSPSSPHETSPPPSDLYPRLIGLTGTYDAIEATCKSYRVYPLTPKDAKPNRDYLVDLRIHFYLMEPSAEFVDAFGRNKDVEDVL